MSNFELGKELESGARAVLANKLADKIEKKIAKSDEAVHVREGLLKRHRFYAPEVYAEMGHILIERGLNVQVDRVFSVEFRDFMPISKMLIPLSDVVVAEDTTRPYKSDDFESLSSITHNQIRQLEIQTIYPLSPDELL